MKIVTNLAVVALGITLFGGAVAFVNRPTDGDLLKTKAKAAVNTLEAQLQRRFHDRNNVSFGMERVVRVGRRLHFDVVADRSSLGMLDQLGNRLPAKRTDKGVLYQIPSGEWRAADKLPRMMHAENEEEREAIKTLNQSGLNIAIYTAGRFDPVGKALRVRGPAFLDYDNLELPSKSELSAVATEAWKSGDESVTVGKWTFLIGRVALDDESCLGCHQANDPSRKPVRVGETAGLFMIAVQPKS